jgi:hypothetical protein
MKKKSRYVTRDGRDYDLTVNWDENFKDSDIIFKMNFAAIDRNSKKALALPREIATYAIGDPQEPLGERVKYYYEGNREGLVTDYLTSAIRRVTDWIERGK